MAQRHGPQPQGRIKILTKKYCRITFRIDGVKWPITRNVRIIHQTNPSKSLGETYARVCNDGSDWEKETKEATIKEIYILSCISF